MAWHDPMTRRWSRLAPLTRLGLFALANGFLFDLVLMGLFLTPWTLTIFGQLHDLLLGLQGEDSWGPMLRAYEYVMSARERPVYSEIFFEQGYKFQYPASTLLIPFALVPFARAVGSSFHTLVNVVSWCAVVSCCACAAWLFHRQARPASGDASKTIPRLLVALVLGLTFYPLLKSYTLGQIQSWINAMFALALLLWVAGRKTGAGVLMGLSCLIKPQYALFVLWGLLRRQWGFAAAFAVTVIVGLVGSLAVVSVADHANYLEVVSFIAERGESYYPNHSVNGLMHRLLFNGYNLGWKGRMFPPYNAWVYGATTISSAVLILVALFWPAAPRRRGGVVDFCILGLTATIASPVAWEHHYGVLLPIFAVLAARLVREQALGARTLPYLVIGYVLCSNFFAASTGLASLPLANIGQSYLFAGALIVWIAMLRLRGRES